ncbi:hypothetical protein K1719_036707 [Acacia pycnantha]|nr:hypothetical protein K1719_036707 [Acacia pycnantha]
MIRLDRSFGILSFFKSKPKNQFHTHIIRLVFSLLFPHRLHPQSQPNKSPMSKVAKSVELFLFVLIILTMSADTLCIFRILFTKMRKESVVVEQTSFETPDTSPSRLERSGSSSGGNEDDDKVEAEESGSPPLFPMKKLPAEACSVSLSNGRSLGTSGSDSHSTLLAPSASILVSDRMLKVVTLTKDALGEFDWSSFILEELSQQIHKFNKDSHKSKATKRTTVGGCVYFLMLFCLQNFAFGDKPSDTTSASFDPHTMLTHPEVRTTYFRLVSMLGQEMLALQDRLTTSPNNQPSSNEKCEEDDDERDEEDDDKEIDEDEDDDNDKEKDDQDDEKEIEDEDDEKDKEDEDDHIVDIDDEDSHLHDTPIVQHGLHVEPTEEYVVEEEVAQPQLQEGERSDGKIRRSKRVITRSSVLKSPWIDPNRKTKGKRPYDEKEQLYELCTTKSIPKDEAEE